MPQVIFIMTDTQRKDMVGCYADTGLRTPALDRLASEGVRFEHAYTCQPVCGPARAALFTGTYPHLNGGWANSLAPGDNVRTLGQRVADHGIPAAYIGKWHLDGSDYFGLGHAAPGWDPAYWYDMRNYLEELTPEERVASRSPALNRDPNLTADFTYGRRCSDRAIRYLEQHAGDDFLLVLSYDEPHHPFICPRPFSEMYRDYRFPKRPNVWDTLADKPAHHRAWAGAAVDSDRDAFQIVHPDYFGCNSFVDDEIGRVLAAVDRCAPGALVIYTSDHGDLLGSHCLGNKGPAMYEEVVNMPFIVRWPGHAPAGAVSQALVSHIDVTPTILDVLGIPQSRTFHGRSLAPVFRQPDLAAADAVFMEFGRYEVDHDGFGGFQPVRACCTPRYKLVVNLLTTDELYDLETDPYEMRNLIEDPTYAAVRDRLHDRLLDWMNETRDPFRGYYWERRPWRTDARPATWDYTLMTRQREEEEYEPRQLDYGTGLEMRAATRLKGK